ncbi:MAG: hypothetical protein FD129_255 [bacterium]|nr:MAG: hypothetical protein FD129_255 [bacterium]
MPRSLLSRPPRLSGPLLLLLLSGALPSGPAWTESAPAYVNEWPVDGDVGGMAVDPSGNVVIAHSQYWAGDVDRVARYTDSTACWLVSNRWSRPRCCLG